MLNKLRQQTGCEAGAVKLEHVKLGHAKLGHAKLGHAKLEHAVQISCDEGLSHCTGDRAHGESSFQPCATFPRAVDKLLYLKRWQT